MRYRFALRVHRLTVRPSPYTRMMAAQIRLDLREESKLVNTPRRQRGLVEFDPRSSHWLRGRIPGSYQELLL